MRWWPLSLQAAHARQASVKVIIEAALLTDEEKGREPRHIAQAAGADYVKTSTGFASGGDGCRWR